MFFLADLTHTSDMWFRDYWYVTLPPSQISSTLASLSILLHNIYTTHICKSYQNSYKKLVDELFTEITMGCWSYNKHPKENLFAYNVNSTTMYEVYCTPRYIFIFINIYSLEEKMIYGVINLSYHIYNINYTIEDIGIKIHFLKQTSHLVAKISDTS